MDSFSSLTQVARTPRTCGFSRQITHSTPSESADGGATGGWCGAGASLAAALAFLLLMVVGRCRQRKTPEPVGAGGTPGPVLVTRLANSWEAGGPVTAVLRAAYGASCCQTKGVMRRESRTGSTVHETRNSRALESTNSGVENAVVKGAVSWLRAKVVAVVVLVLVWVLGWW